MASILHGPLGQNLKPVSEPPSHLGFQYLFALACERVDAPERLPFETPVQRSSPRKKVALRGECVGAWGSSRCLISDFGDGGLALVCGHPHHVGDRLRIRWTLGGLLSEVDCDVRHVTGAYIGVQFVDVSPGQRARLVASLHQASNNTHRAAA